MLSPHFIVENAHKLHPDFLYYRNIETFLLLGACIPRMHTIYGHLPIITRVLDPGPLKLGSPTAISVLVTDRLTSKPHRLRPPVIGLWLIAEVRTSVAAVS